MTGARSTVTEALPRPGAGTPPAKPGARHRTALFVGGPGVGGLPATALALLAMFVLRYAATEVLVYLSRTPPPPSAHEPRRRRRTPPAPPSRKGQRKGQVMAWL